MSTSAGKGVSPMMRVTETLLGFVGYLRLASILLIFGLLVGIAYYVFMPAVYYSRALVEVQVFRNPVLGDDQDNFGVVRRSLADQLNSRYMIAEATHRLGIGKPTDSFETMRDRGLLKKVSCGFVDNSLLQISVWSTEPRIVQDFATTLIKTYQDEQRRLRNQYIDDAIERYEDDIERLRQKIAEKGADKQQFVEENALMEAMIQHNELAQVPVQLVAYQAQLRRFDEVDRVLELKEGEFQPLEELSILSSARFAQADQHIGKILPASGDLHEALRQPLYDPKLAQTVVVQPAMVDGVETWQALEMEKRTLEQEMEEASKRYLPGHEVMKEFSRKIAAVDDSILVELEVERKRFEVEYARLKQDIEELETKLPEYTQMNEKLNLLRQEYQLQDEGEMAWDKAYKDLSKVISGLQYKDDHEQIDLMYKGFSSLRDVDPVSPSKSKLAMLALCLGVGLAIGVPFGLRRLDDRLSRIEKLELATGVKGVGLIPKADQYFLETPLERNAALESDRPHPVLECYRVARSHLQLQFNQHPGCKVVMTTSSRPSEGKTTFSTNLGWALQSGGERVLLVDLDFRRGRIHKILRLPNKLGMSQILAGECTVAEGVNDGVLPGMDVATRGRCPPGAFEMLCTGALDEQIAKWREDYDWIVLDCPPVLGLAETVTLQRVTDGVVLVVRAEMTPMSDVLDSVEKLQKAGANLAGFVLNGLDLSRMSNHYYHYYSSGYHYYYDHHEEEEEELEQAHPSPVT